MFSTLSFKKFQRRIRLPFTFFKKLTKKQRKNATHKRQHSKQNDTHSKSGAEDKPVEDTLAVPALDVKTPSTPNTIASSDSGVFFPPTPKTSSAESGPASRVHVLERALPEIVDEDEIDLSAQAETNVFVLSEEKGVVADMPVEVAIDQEEVKADPVDIKDAGSVENTPSTIEVEVEAKQQAMLAAFYTQSVSVVDVAQDNRQSTAIEVEGTPLSIQDEVDAKEPEKTSAPCPEPESANELTVVEPADQDEVTEVGMTPLASEEEQPAPPVVSVPAGETSTKATEPTVQEVKEVKRKSEDNQLVKSTAVEKFPQELHIVTTKGGDAFKLVSTQHSPPQTPRSASSQKFLTPTTPRKRVTSEGQTQKDKEIMGELQASVRSREKKRKEQERIQAAEKERKQRELSAKLEMERKKADEFADGDGVLRDIRSWRKQREASLKKSPDDAAKIAAYREAFAREEIMLELQSAVQNRSARGPYVEDPAEKRQQLLLEELYASRVPATKA